ncbi:MAG: DUF2384 domain-containing protein [Gammaproteobacteria bacterium]
MTQSKKQEPNRTNKIVPYRSVKSGMRSKGWLSTIPGNIQESAKRVLGYAGIEYIEIPGSFLGDAVAITNLSVTDIIAVLDMSKSSFYRNQKAEELEMETVDKLSSLFRIYQQGIEAFETPEAFEEWLHSRVTNLGDQKPVDLIKSETGRATVLDAIKRIEYGIYG